MPVLQQQTNVRFGIFELDLQARELYRNGVRIRLAPQPLDLLIALLQQPGTVLTRESLQQRLWPPGTFVDFEHGLNKTVRKLREVLGDSAEAPRYIETVQRTGYRFIAPVSLQEAAVLPIATDVASAPATAPPLTVSADVAQPNSPAALAVERSSVPRYAIVAALTGLLLIGAAALAILGLRKSGSHASTPTATNAGTARDPKAQEAYLHGRYLWFAGHPFAASDYFKRALEIEPDYGAAWVGMSLYYGAALVGGRVDPAGALVLQGEAADRALRFAPDLAEAHLAACGFIFLNTWQYQAANKECDRARQLDPADAEIYHFQSKMLAAAHREAGALEVQRTASRLDSLSKPWALTQALMQARRYDEAFAEGRARLEAFPHDPRMLNSLAYISLYRGNTAQFADYLAQSYRSDGDEASAAQIADAFRSGGAPAVAHWRLEQLLKQGRTGYVSPFRLALAYISVGDREQALSQLATALERRTPDLLWIRCYPEFDVLATVPRYQQILQHLPTL